MGWSRPYFAYRAARISGVSFSSLKGEPGISCIRMNSTSRIASSVNSEVRIRLSVYFFTSGGPPFSFRDLAVSRLSAADRHNAKKAHSGFLRATVRPCSVCFQFYSLLAAFLYTRFRATGWNATPVTAEETISALHWPYRGKMTACSRTICSASYRAAQRPSGSSLT